MQIEEVRRKSDKGLTYEFLAETDRDVPILFINGNRLAIVSFDLSFETKSETFSGRHTIIASGYFDYEKRLGKLRTFSIDLTTKGCIEL